MSFLFALIFVYLLGYTFNFMVMFGMLLGLGMLIDGAIVVTEYADRKMTEGFDRRAAYSMAAKRMFWPVTASIATTLAAFLPLMFWPGVSGKFMRYLPVTVFTVLSGSLVYALIFGPVLGSLFGRAGTRDQKSMQTLKQLEDGDPTRLKTSPACIRPSAGAGQPLCGGHPGTDHRAAVHHLLGLRQIRPGHDLLLRDRSQSSPRSRSRPGATSPRKRSTRW